MPHYPTEAIDFAKILVKNAKLEGPVALQILNTINEQMWMAAPFRWTVGTSPNVILSADNAEYTMDYPDDWLYALQAILTDDGDMHKKELDIVANIPLDIGREGTVSSIAYLGVKGQSSGPVRINPIPSSVNGDKIIGLYKKSCSLITAKSRYDTYLPIPDEWYHVYQAGVLWLAYTYADDRRAGETVVSGQDSKFSGWRAEFEHGLNQMRLREKFFRSKQEPEGKDANV